MQKGSLVGPDRLRFDFTHDAPLTDDETFQIEDLVNTWIEANEHAEVREMPYSDAIESGAVAIFEEKYGDRVRVVSMGEHSTELCGGTHASATGDVGLLAILSESGIAAGVRRIEALTGLGALSHFRSQQNTLRRAADLLRSSPAELPDRVEKLLDERRELEREIEKMRAGERKAASKDITSAAKNIGGVRVVASRVEGVDGKALRGMVDDMRAKLGTGVVLLVAEGAGRVSLALGVTKDLTDRFKAGDLVREIAAVVGGKGGGRPDFAQAGGSDPSKIDEAIELFESLLSEG
jgi:alanyl-tRNA synthetase